jgi:hypothetical protein
MAEPGTVKVPVRLDLESLTPAMFVAVNARGDVLQVFPTREAAEQLAQRTVGVVLLLPIVSDYRKGGEAP